MKSENKIIILISLVSLVFLISGVWLFNKSNQKLTEKLNKPEMGQEIPDLGGIHVARGKTHPAYNSNPPTSGWHWGDGVAGSGIKNKIVPDELILHSMEHGAVVVWYKEGLPKDDIDKIKKAFQSASGKKIMLARKNLTVPVALTSWNYLLKLKTINSAKIIEFIETNSDRAPEKAPI